MSGPRDPDPTRAYEPPGGDPTQPVGAEPTRPMAPGGPRGGGPAEPFWEDEGGRPWWVYALAVLAAGVVVGVLLALLVGGDDDEEPRTTTTSSSTTTTTTTTAPAITTVPPTAPPTTAASPPSQVTGLSAGPGGGSGEVSLTWNPVPTAVSYRIYRSSTMGASGSLIGTVNATSYVDTPGDGSWYYRVSAVNAAGLEGPRSAEACGAPVGSSC